jgi:phosphatidylglycerophosphate synthase
MFDQIFRIAKEHSLEPLAKGPLNNVNPTSITILGSVVGIGAGVASWRGQAGMALGLWFLNRFLDGLDGTIARVNNKQSDFGGYLDIVLDMVAYVSIPLGVAFSVNETGVYIALALLFASFYINIAAWMMLSASLEKRAQGAKSRNELTTVTMPKGIIEGGETILFFSLFILFQEWLTLLFGLMAILVISSAIYQIRWAYLYLKMD